MLGNASVTIMAVSTTADDHGDSTTSATPSTLPWAVIAPRSSDERVESTSPAVITAATLYAPYGTELDADDTVTVAGHSPQFDGDWQVEGIPGPWASPFSDWRPGIEVALKRAT